GDTFIRMLRKRGRNVEVQNYIDNTGVQVADVVAGFHHLEKRTISDVRALLADQTRPFDYLCWDLYARISAYYGDNPAALEWQGKNKGCWVMPSIAFRDSAAGNDTADDSKVIVRSNGTVTYVSKDIAYQLWKFGLLRKDFYYRPWSSYDDGHRV